MGMFNKYGHIVYPLLDENGDTKEYTITDILTRVRVNMTDTEFTKMTQEYTVEAKETPESISLKMYGIQDYYWTILYINNMFDYLGDWYLDDERLTEFVKAKYGEDHLDDSAYIIDKYGMIIANPDPSLGPKLTEQYGDNNPQDLKVITNWQYESFMNEGKKYIRIVKPAYIKDFVDNFNAQLLVNA